MCCCPAPNINGTPNGYSWDGKSILTRKPDAPTVNDSDELIRDEPGRCGNGVGDSHCHHFTLVKQTIGGYALLVRHGGGDERISLGGGHRKALINVIASLDSNAAYALMHHVYYTVKDAELFARNKEAHKWRTAAAEKRIKTRKLPRSATVKVWIELPGGGSEGV